MSKQSKRHMGGSGEALPSGAAGEVITRQVSIAYSAQNGWRASAALTAIPAGVWVVFGQSNMPDSESTANYFIMATNGNNDGTGQCTGLAGSSGQIGATTQNLASPPMIYFVNTSGSTTFYGKIFVETALTRTFTMNFYFLRIA